MAKRVLCIASSLAAASVVYKADQISRRHTGDSKRCSPCSQCNDEKSKIQSAIERTREQIIRLKNEVGAPGIVVGVSVDGKIIWKEGIGFLDLENQVPANEDTVMRIASISKSLTAAVIGRLWQEGTIDIDQPIQKYVPSFPEKTFRDGKVTITTRQLMCHLSGIRHYSKMKKDDALGAGDGQLGEFYGKERYESIEKALSIFKNDELLHPPGSKYLYSTYGFTLLSAVMEGATGKTYPQLIRAFLREMGMRRTYLDEPEPIIYGRSKCYGKNKNGKIINSPYVDNSCKWAGGGILSTVGDLLKFANSMLYAYQFGDAIDVSKAKQVVGAGKSKSTETFAVSQKKADDRKTISEGNSERDVLKLEGTKIEKGLNEVGENAASLSKNLGVETGNIGSSSESRVLSKSEKGGDEVRGEDDASTSIIGEENKSSLINVDRLKEAGVYAGAAMKYLGKGVSNTSRYVWKKVWPTSEKQEEKTVGEDDVSASGSGMASAENENNQNTVSNVDRLKDVGSHVTTAAIYIGQGVANVSSFIWDKVQPTSGKEGKTIGEDDGGASSSGMGSAENENNQNTVSNVDRLKDVGSHVTTAATYIGQGVANVSSFIWDKVQPTSGKEEETVGKDDGGASSSGMESAENENNQNTVSNLDRLKDVGSHVTTAATYIGQGVANASTFIWDKVQPTSGKEGKTIGEDDGGASSSGMGSAENENNQNTVSNVDRLKDVGSHVTTAATYIGQGVANVSSFIWDKVQSTSGKEEETVGRDDGGASSSGVGSAENENNQNTVSNVDRLKDVGSHVTTAATYIGQGVANASTFIWDKVQPTIGKEGKTIGEDDGGASSSSMGSAENENNQNTVSNLDSLQDVGSHVTTAATYIGQGVANASSYVWDKVWSTKNEIEKDKSVKIQSESSIINAAWNSTVGHIWTRISTGDEENKVKEFINNEEESRSWSSYLKNIFNPKALDSFSGQDFYHEFHSNDISSFDELPPVDEMFIQGILMKKIIPSAVKAVLGLSNLEICDSEIIEDSSHHLSREKAEETKSIPCQVHSPAPENIVSKSFNRPYISQKTVASLWTRVESTKFSDWGPYVEGGYGLGFGVAPAVDSPGGVDDGGQPFIVGHTGGAVGASSALIIIPRGCGGNDPPKGVAVVIITNLQSVSLNPLAIEIARLFANATQ